MNSVVEKFFQEAEDRLSFSPNYRIRKYLIDLTKKCFFQKNSHRFLIYSTLNIFLPKRCKNKITEDSTEREAVTFHLL